MPFLKTKRRVGRVAAGQVHKFTSYETRALVALGYAERLPAKPVQVPATFTEHEQAATVNAARAKRTYKRRDMVAEPWAVEVTVAPAKPEGAED